YSYEVIKDIADYLLQRTSVRPVIGIICGSGLSSLADNITDTQSFAYEDIPNFPVSTVEGHVGRLIFGYLEGLPVMAMQGRFHYMKDPNDPRFGPRFPPMANAYDAHLIKRRVRSPKIWAIDSEVHEGVYTCLGGPNYETVAELKMLHIMGVDAVGMIPSTSLITNKCALEYNTSGEQANHEEVVSVGKSRQAICRELLCRVLKEIGKEFNLPTKQ
ncbi:hypothetical protein DOY81_013700, partial [Sarcophaga bullata]